MAKAGRGADQYMLRFPRGLRDRVKDAAERSGRSMNEEIIRTLEKEYPEPWPLDVRLKDLATLMAAFRKVRGHERAIDSIAEEILTTAEAIASGQVLEIDEEVRKRVRRDLAKWRDQISKREKARQEAVEYNRNELDAEPEE